MRKFGMVLCGVAVLVLSGCESTRHMVGGVFGGDEVASGAEQGDLNEDDLTQGNLTGGDLSEADLTIPPTASVSSGNSGSSEPSRYVEAERDRVPTVIVATENMNGQDNKFIAFKASKSLKIDAAPLAVKPVDNVAGIGGDGLFLDAVAVMQGVRIGETQARTRVVFDLSAAAEYSIRLIEGSDYTALVAFASVEKAMDGFKAMRVSNDGLIANYEIEQTGQGAVAEITFRRPVKIVRQEALAPNGRYGYRVFVDFAPIVPSK